MPRPVLRPAFVTTFSAAIATIATACGGHTSGATTGDGGVVPSEGGADCPAQLPASGSACSLPDSQECSWTDSCGFQSMGSCDQGQWNIAALNPPAPGCPTSPPQSGTPCPCAPTNGCNYPTGACNGQPQNEIATCQPNGTWQVSISTCNPPAVFDAGMPGEAGVPADAAEPADANGKGD
jgi:hypothetical protein